MPGLPRQITEYMDRLAAAVREAEQQRSVSGPSNDSGLEIMSWVVRQVATCGFRFTTNDSSFTVSRHNRARQPELPGDASRGARFATRAVNDLLDSSDLQVVTRKCAEYMGVMDAELLPGDYLAELFLAAYDTAQRKGRGVYYTPWPIIRYLVRSVDALLRNELGVPLGLAAMGGKAKDRPTLVDPACGTGLFLRAALHHLHTQGLTSLARGSPGSRSCTERMRGFDIIPSAIEAARALFDLEFPHQAPCDEMFHCRSALTRDTDFLVDEARTESSPLVILGNPPYANFGSANRDPWILELMSSYRDGLGERKHNLHDDAWKFLRWSQYQVERAGRGIVAFVINHAFLDGLTHRQLRASLLETFDQLYFYNLHGSRWKPSNARADNSAGRDENVFGVRCGITLCLLVCQGASRRDPVVSYAELRGSRQYKLQQLADETLSTTRWYHVERTSGACVPFDLSTASACREAGRVESAGTRYSQPHAGDASHGMYEIHESPVASSNRPFEDYVHGWGLDEIFAHYVSGVQTKKDALFTDHDYQTLAERMREYAFRNSVDRGNEESQYDATKLRPYMVAPFDVRWIYYEPRWLGRARFEVMRHLLEPNLALVFMRQSTNGGEYDQFLVTTQLVSDRVFHSGHGAPYAAPLFLTQESRQPMGNFQDEFLAGFERELGMCYRMEAGSGDRSFGPRDLLAYLYGVAWTPSYRRQFAAELPRGFPRIPRPTTVERFRGFAELGEQLLKLHGGVCPTHDVGSEVASPQEASPRVATAQVAEGIPPAVWDKRIGGVAVVPRWLKQRQKRGLSESKQVYLRHLVESLAETLQLERRLESLVTGSAFRAET